MPEPSPVETSLRPDRHPALVAAVVGVVAFVVCEALLLGRPLNRYDEAWMLWVGARISRGDVLYRQVYDVSTPIAAWTVGLGEWVLGVHLAVLRTLSALTFAGSVVLAWSTARAVGASVRARVLLAVALLAFGSPVVVFVNLYSAIAILGALVALRASLWWADHRDDPGSRVSGRALAVTAVGVGIAFWSKPNVGVLAGLAVVVLVLAARSRESWRQGVTDAAVLAGTFVAVAVPFVVAIVATRAWSDFVGQVFLSKGEYLDVGFSYVSSIGRRLSDLGRGGPHGDLRAVVPLLTAVTPVLLLGTAVAGAWRARRTGDPRVAGLAAFTVAGVLAILPRPGANHIGATLPLALTSAVALWCLVPRIARPVRRTLAVVLVVATGFAVVVVGRAGVHDWSDGSRWSAPFAPAVRRSDDAAALRRLREGLARSTDGRVFIARQDAAYFYLSTGAVNPLPFDIVQRSDLGVGDEAAVIGRLQRGEAAFVCLYPPRPPGTRSNPLIARRLERWVRNRFVPVAQLTSCDLYAAPASSAATKAS